MIIIFNGNLIVFFYCLKSHLLVSNRIYFFIFSKGKLLILNFNKISNLSLFPKIKGKFLNFDNF